jgi:hypothetical protein
VGSVPHTWDSRQTVMDCDLQGKLCGVLFRGLHSARTFHVLYRD